MNVALYGPSRDHWAFTERGRAAVQRDEHALAIGPSAMWWEGGALVIEFDETTAPFGSRLAGRVRICPEERDGTPLSLDAEGKHCWWPIAPAARAEVELTHPRLSFRGAAYHDANAGDEPLESAFESWTWSRVACRERAVVTYDVIPKGGGRRLISRSFERGGHIHDDVPVEERSLPPTRWGLDRPIQVGAGTTPELLRTLEDTPFYSRSMVRASYLGSRAVGVHETLSLGRFASSWVQFLLPFRMKRSAR
jgi:carotenoid 1,2-hydratase